MTVDSEKTTRTRRAWWPWANPQPSTCTPTKATARSPAKRRSTSGRVELPGWTPTSRIRAKRKSTPRRRSFNDGFPFYGAPHSGRKSRLRHTTVTKNGKSHTYWRLVRSIRTGNRVRQQTVAQLGELDAAGRVRARALAEAIVGVERQPGLFEAPDPSESVTVELLLRDRAVIAHGSFANCAISTFCEIGAATSTRAHLRPVFVAASSPLFNSRMSWLSWPKSNIFPPSLAFTSTNSSTSSDQQLVQP
jgi:hypothetical protein